MTAVCPLDECKDDHPDSLCVHEKLLIAGSAAIVVGAYLFITMA